MNDENIGVEEDFYRDVAKMLKCDGYVYREFPFGRRTRWNNRTAGNGRFPGHGLVRYFGPTHIQVSLTTPLITGLFHNTNDALSAIQAKLSEASFE